MTRKGRRLFSAAIAGRSEFMAYLEGLVYHEREVSEGPRLREVIMASLRSEEHRQEVEAMHRTMADVDREKGELAMGRRRFR